MSETTEFIKKPNGDTSPGESALRGISIRAWLALMVTFTGCLMVLSGFYDKSIAIPSDFMMLWISVLSYYFGKQINSNPPTSGPILPTPK